jgi:hypothetical protein
MEVTRPPGTCQALSRSGPPSTGVRRTSPRRNRPPARARPAARTDDRRSNSRATLRFLSLFLLQPAPWAKTTTPAGLPHHRPLDGRAVADVDPHPVQRLPALANEDQIRDTEDARPPRGDPVAHRRGSRGVLDGERPDVDPLDDLRATDGHHAALFDSEAVHRLPRPAGRVDRALRAVPEAEGMVGMRVGHEDGPSPQLPYASPPVLPAVDREAAPPMFDAQCAVTSVSPGTPVGIPPGSLEDELHRLPVVDCPSPVHAPHRTPQVASGAPGASIGSGDSVDPRRAAR